MKAVVRDVDSQFERSALVATIKQQAGVGSVSVTLVTPTAAAVSTPTASTLCVSSLLCYVFTLNCQLVIAVYFTERQ